MDKSNKPQMADEQVENLIRRSLTNRMDKEPERYGTFLAIQDRLDEKTKSRFIQMLLDSLGFRWRVTSMFRKRIAQGAAIASVAVVLVAYMAFLGSDSRDEGTTNGVAAGGGEPTAEVTDEIVHDDAIDDEIDVYPTIGAPPINTSVELLDPRPMRQDLLDPSSMSDSELATAWTGYLVASRLIFDDGVSGYQDWRICGNSRGVIVDDRSGRNVGQYFTWDLDIASNIASFGVDLDLDGRTPLVSETGNNGRQSLGLKVSDGVMIFDLGTAEPVKVAVMDALHEADRCPEHAPGPPNSGHIQDVDNTSLPLGTVEPPK